MKIIQVKKIAISDQIAQQIQGMVSSGEVQPGDKLPSEREMCEEFGASRTAVREAVSGLMAKGIVERRNKGIYVSTFSNGLLVESMEMLIATKKIPISYIFEARLVVEVENARLAAMRATNEDIEGLEQCVMKIEDKGSPESVIRKNATDFHKLIAKATHNPFLEDFFDAMIEVFLNDPRSVSTLSRSASSHRYILDKIRSHDAIGAGEEMRQHLKIVAESFG